MNDPIQAMIWIIVTLSIYFVMQLLYLKLRWLILHPVLISIFLIIALLRYLDLDYEQYNEGGIFISFFLGPSVVALGVLLHEKFEVIK